MKVVFLDRDGVINKYPGEGKYVTGYSGFQFLPNAKKALRLLTKNKFKIFVISNQSGVRKGLYSKTALGLITKNMLKSLKSAGAKIGGVYYCTHKDEDNCFCRKPKTGLINLALKRYKKENIDFRRSFLIGDNTVDIQTGRAAGFKTILVFSGKEKPRNKKSWPILPDYTASGLYAAVKVVLRNQ